MDNKRYDMKILITGANGFIGSCVYRKFLREGFEIIPLVLEPTGFDNEIVIDFTDPDFVAKINKLPKVDAIVHTASKIGWYGFSLPELFAPNVLATAELANLANRMGAYFIFTSAAIVCGVENPLITSVTKTDPDTDYGYSKWLAEEIIQISGVKHLILRISGVFGKNGPAHLGINKAINKAIKGEVPELIGDGIVKRNYIYVEDLAKLIFDAIQRKITGIHLVGSVEIKTIKQMLDEICQVFLPRHKPLIKLSDNQAKDQIVEPSKDLFIGRKFIEALYDIREKTKCK